MEEYGEDRGRRFRRKAIWTKGLLPVLNFGRTQPFPCGLTFGENILLGEQVPGEGLVFGEQRIEGILFQITQLFPLQPLGLHRFWRQSPLPSVCYRL